jgi:enoyl-CoA hydratase
VTTTVDDAGIAVVRIDDGKANAFSPTVIEALNAALDQAEAEARAVLLVGRPGRFSAGFDLSVMQEGMDAARALVRSGAELALRFYELPMPVVMACTGHALAMGVITLLAGDVRIGAEGDFKLGLNEVAIGMPVPKFATELARDRLTPRAFTRAVNLAEIHTPAQAVEAGYLDEVVAADDLLAVATERAVELADRVKPAAFALTRVNTRGATVQLIRDSLDADMALFDIAT